MLKFFKPYLYGTNFWEVNSHALDVECFKKLYDVDASEGKTDSSTVMWAIHLIHDSESPYQQLEEPARIKRIEKDFIKHENYFASTSVLVKACINEYIELDKGAIERGLIAWYAKIDDFKNLMNTTPVTLENMDRMLNLQAKFPDMMAKAEALIAAVQKAKNRQMKGNQSLSMLYEDTYQKNHNKQAYNENASSHGYMQISNTANDKV